MVNLMENAKAPSLISMDSQSAIWRQTVNVPLLECRRLSAGSEDRYYERLRIGALLLVSLPPSTVRWYMDKFRPLFRELAILCETEDDLRKLDKHSSATVLRKAYTA
jgi:hypothetical protein